MPSSLSLLRRGAAIASLTASWLIASQLGAFAAGEGAAPAARVEHAIAETELATLQLSERAVERLGIETVAVARVPMQLTRLVGGIVEAPPGGVMAIVAPQQGIVLAGRSGSLPLPGTPVRAGDELLRLRVLSPAEIARVREIVDIAAARLVVAEDTLRQKPADAALQSEREDARAALEAARLRLRAMSGDTAVEAGLGLAPLAIESPMDGVVRRLDTAVGQSVPSGARLLELVQIDPVWVRVPVYAGLLDSIRSGAAARIRRLGQREGEGRAGTPVAGPPTASPLAATVDLYFRVSNRSGALRPGERVTATLALRGDALRLVVPRAAVLYDVNGGAWVYERTGSGRFSRRRVAIAHVTDRLAVLERGPAEGREVVTAGAAELFGTEFGTGE